MITVNEEISLALNAVNKYFIDVKDFTPDTLNTMRNQLRHSFHIGIHFVVSVTLHKLITGEKLVWEDSHFLFKKFALYLTKYRLDENEDWQFSFCNNKLLISPDLPNNAIMCVSSEQKTRILFIKNL